MSTPPDPPPLPVPQFLLDEFLPYKLNVLANILSRRLSIEYSNRFGILVSEWRVIATLAGGRQLTSKDICIETFMDKTKISRAVVSLEKRGCVVRKPNPDDRRAAFIELTEEGRQLFDRIVPLALKNVQILTEGLSEADLGHFRRVLDMLIERATIQSQMHSLNTGENFDAEFTIDAL